MGTKAEGIERLLTIAQAAELTNYDEATIRLWMDRGLPYIASGEGRKRPRLKDRRIKASELWTWVNGLTITRHEAPAVAKGKAKVPAGGLGAWRERKGGA